MNFKKHISFFLALFLLLANSSASLVMHFCHDQIAYISLVYQDNKLVDTAEEDSCCATAVVSEEKSCCSNEEIKVDKKIDYSILKAFQFDFTAVPFEIKTPSAITPVEGNALVLKITDYYCDSNAPPLYKLYSQLVFYA